MKNILIISLLCGFTVFAQKLINNSAATKGEMEIKKTTRHWQNLEVGIISDKNIFMEREPVYTIFYLGNNGPNPVN